MIDWRFMTKSKILPVSQESEEKYHRTECNAETLCEVENKILHPLVLKAMQAGWREVNHGKYASRAEQIDPEKVDIGLLFNIKGKERMIAGLLDHEKGSHADNIEGLCRALEPYVRPTVNDYSYEDIAPEKMGVYIDQKGIERNKSAILHEAQHPGEKEAYCTHLKETLLQLDFGKRLKRKQFSVYKRMKRYLQSSEGENLCKEIARTDAQLNTNTRGISGVKLAAENAANIFKTLILHKPKLILCLISPAKFAGLIDNKHYWCCHNDDNTGILGYLQQHVSHPKQ